MTHWLDLSQVYGDSEEEAKLVASGGLFSGQNSIGKIKLVKEGQIEGGIGRKYICIEKGCFFLGKYPNFFSRKIMKNRIWTFSFSSLIFQIPTDNFLTKLSKLTTCVSTYLE